MFVWHLKVIIQAIANHNYELQNTSQNSTVRKLSTENLSNIQIKLASKTVTQTPLI